jgi:hypothetical protein
MRLRACDRPFAAIVTILLMLGLAAPAPRADSADATPSVLSSNEISEWKVALKRSGASKGELFKFEKLANPPSKRPSSWFLDFIQKNPPSKVLGLVRSVIRYESEPKPADIFPSAPPVMSCEALRDLSVTDATIDSVVSSPSDNSCRITATITHPPAHKPVKVFVALPIKGWNGRFRGTGGAGYAGGFIESLDAPVAQGYVVGATDTGNPEGTANVALDLQGKPAWQRMRDNGYRGIQEKTVS